MATDAKKTEKKVQTVDEQIKSLQTFTYITLATSVVTLGACAYLLFSSGSKEDKKRKNDFNNGERY